MEQLQTWMDGARGRRKTLAGFLRITASALSQWTRVPAVRVLEVENLTGISRFALRPDIYGTNTERPPAPGPDNRGDGRAAQ